MGATYYHPHLLLLFLPFSHLVDMDEVKVRLALELKIGLLDVLGFEKYGYCGPRPSDLAQMWLGKPDSSLESLVLQHRD
jgi:hypothetical protein